MQIVGIPIWMAELVPSRQRGMLMDLHAVALIIGYFSAQWIGYGFYFYHGSVLSFRPVLGNYSLDMSTNYDRKLTNCSFPVPTPSCLPRNRMADTREPALLGNEE